MKRPAIDSMAREAARGAEVTPAQARRVIDLFLAILRDQTWQEGTVQIRGFGTFSIRRTKARVSGTPPGAHLVVTTIASRQVVRFKPTKNWRFK